MPDRTARVAARKTVPAGENRNETHADARHAAELRSSAYLAQVKRGVRRPVTRCVDPGETPGQLSIFDALTEAADGGVA